MSRWIDRRRYLDVRFTRGARGAAGSTALLSPNPALGVPTQVESVPAELRSSVALEAYFDSLFPGQIHRYAFVGAFWMDRRFGSRGRGA